MYKSFTPSELETRTLHGYLLTAVAPRPIALASTINEKGNVNLSPFSFFNVFSANPPIMIFSPARRVKDNTTKHTLENVLETKEVVINIVSYDIVQQMSLSSTEYAEGINEFEKAGFTQVNSDNVKPPRVGESKVAFECKVNEVIQLGNQGGAGNLVICEVVKFHIKEEVLNEEGNIDPLKMDLVGRMGGMYYNSTFDASLFTIPKPLAALGVGFDQLPKEIRESTILSGNDLAMLANVEKIPSKKEANDRSIIEKHQKAKELLAEKKVEEAWQVLL
ncbi:uncharacterized protein UJ101_00172 [Flavobacteriaceae bacterium UJ101]|nr:uncharacterized protein UJ101_00172 [Flavobacteriaceae bacterium UJ101]